MDKNEALSDVSARPKAVFSKGLGTIKGFKADIKIQDGAQTVFHRAWPVPYALYQKVVE